MIERRPGVTLIAAVPNSIREEVSRPQRHGRISVTELGIAQAHFIEPLTCGNRRIPNVSHDNQLRGSSFVHTPSLVLTSGLLCLWAGAATTQQYPMPDQVAGRVVQKYQTSSCEQLDAERAHPSAGRRAEMKERVVRLLREDPGMRQEFLNRVAGPIANKLFECGLIP